MGIRRRWRRETGVYRNRPHSRSAGVSRRRSSRGVDVGGRRCSPVQYSPGTSGSTGTFCRSGADFHDGEVKGAGLRVVMVSQGGARVLKRASRCRKWAPRANLHVVEVAELVSFVHRAPEALFLGPHFDDDERLPSLRGPGSEARRAGNRPGRHQSEWWRPATASGFADFEHGEFAGGAHGIEGFGLPAEWGSWSRYPGSGRSPPRLRRWVCWACCMAATTASGTLAF